jgi:hypothetical protein
MLVCALAHGTNNGLVATPRAWAGPNWFASLARPMSGALLKFVDGKDVTDQGAQAFDLLPGCHVVQTAKNLMIASDYVMWRGPSV